MTPSSRQSLPARTLSTRIHGPDGAPAVKIESLIVHPRQTITLTFGRVGDRWRQGVFLGTNGTLATNGVTSPALVLWRDGIPNPVVVDVAETDGRLVVYNVWDSGRGRRFESQCSTSGMLVERPSGDTWRFSCTDIGAEPDFGRLVFTLAIR